ncbi:iron chelate uptake ABC transporter family permease subunit [Phytomonospora sp. NPDC050363]|uniref:FecCD family ABC transporter permease n=1 Tax=Phytomonospora sp. NPDC050363 TaxID=3155642 RepID=UPI0033DCBD74
MTVLRHRSISLRLRARPLLVAAGCALITAAVAVVSIGSGDYPLSPAEVVTTLLGEGSRMDAFVVNELRLPRVATALVVGIALGLSGTVFQALVRNPLGSPDVLGFTQGASAGALTVIVLFGGGGAVLAGGAVVGGLVTGAIMFGFAGRAGAHGYRLVLVGIGLAAILSGVNGYLLTKAQIIDAAQASLWLTGSLDGRGWDDALPLAVLLVAVIPLLVAASRALLMLEMGDQSAGALGVPVGRLRLLLFTVSVLLVSFAAAAAGPVSFVALTAPHLARRLTRAPGPNLLASATMGAAILVVADWVAQRAFPGHQLPVGVVSGLLGGGYLVWLLVTERKAGRI